MPYHPHLWRQKHQDINKRTNVVLYKPKDPYPTYESCP